MYTAEVSFQLTAQEQQRHMGNLNEQSVNINEMKYISCVAAISIN